MVRLRGHNITYANARGDCAPTTSAIRNMQRQRLLASVPVQPMETMTAACARQRQGVSVHTRYPSYLFPPLPSLFVGREGRATGWKPLPPAACPRSVTDLGPTAGRSPEADSASCCGSTRGAKEQFPNAYQALWRHGCVGRRYDPLLARRNTHTGSKRWERTRQGRDTTIEEEPRTTHGSPMINAH